MRTNYTNMAEDIIDRAVSRLEKAYPHSILQTEKDIKRQGFLVTKTDQGVKTATFLSYSTIKKETPSDLADMIMKRFQKEEKEHLQSKTSDSFSEWKGFKETGYNWCIIVDEHWVCEEDEELIRTDGAKLDLTDECFLRIYCTRRENYMDSLDWLIAYLKKNFLRTENWYEIKVYRGNTSIAPFIRYVLKADIGKKEGTENAEGTEESIC